MYPFLYPYFYIHIKYKIDTSYISYFNKSVCGRFELIRIITTDHRIKSYILNNVLLSTCVILNYFT